jgi:hypothetical protein
MKFNSAYLVFILLSYSCTDAPTLKGLNEIKTEHKQPVKKPQSNYSDTLNVFFEAAVFYGPDSLQLEKIKSLTDIKVFDGSMHEYYYLMKNAHAVLKKNFPELKIIEVRNVRYLLFMGVDKERNIIDLDAKNDAYGLFVFDRKKAPQLLDMSNIESELGAYFSK